MSSSVSFSWTDPTSWIALGVSMGAGILVAVMIRLNATLGAHIGVLESSFVVHAIGTAFATGLLVPRLALLRTRIQKPAPHLFLGGVCGVFIVLLANVVVPFLGVALMLSLSIAANLVVSTVADHYGWFGLPIVPLSKRRIAGVVLALLGVGLVAFA